CAFTVRCSCGGGLSHRRRDICHCQSNCKKKYCFEGTGLTMTSRRTMLLRGGGMRVKSIILSLLFIILAVSLAMATMADAQCSYNGALPDAKCTPGAIDTHVTQDTIGQTICVRGYAKTIRPAFQITTHIKAITMRAYGNTVYQPDSELIVNCSSVYGSGTIIQDERTGLCY